MGMPLPSTTTAIEAARADGEATAAEQRTMTSPEEARRLALELAGQRRTIDGQIDELVQVLKSNNVTMTSPLVDAEGFPDAAIDIVAVRSARAQLIALRNDRSALEARLRDLVQTAFARADQGSQSDQPASQEVPASGGAALPSLSPANAMARVPGTNGALSMSVPVQHGDSQSWAQVGGLTPFARVNTVAPGSPAALADLRANDQILQFDTLTLPSVHRSPTQRDLGNLPSVVQEGRTIEVVVLRLGQPSQSQTSTLPLLDGNGSAEDYASQAASIKRLRLTPMSNWGGRGLLGCHILPVE